MKILQNWIRPMLGKVFPCDKLSYRTVQVFHCKSSRIVFERFSLFSVLIIVSILTNGPELQCSIFSVVNSCVFGGSSSYNQFHPDICNDSSTAGEEMHRTVDQWLPSSY
jgi:hypothetical protein